ncbi:MAG TPA: hypothetical protein PLN21_09830 [Gemmatales bacterium]|nr:hypothetical protein [Gemmatales bacterium]
MKSIILNPTLQKVIVCLFVVLLFVVFFWPGPFVSDELLSQIKPGMSIEDAHSILGNSWIHYKIWGPATHGGFDEDWREWKWESKSLQLRAIAPDGSHPGPFQGSFHPFYWVSEKQKLLWVEARDGVIVQVWIVPLKPCHVQW